MNPSPETGGDVPARHHEVDRQHEGELIESGPRGSAAIAGLLARFQPPPSPRQSVDSTNAPQGPVSGTPAWGLEQLAKAIVSKAAALLDIKEIDTETDLFDAGATSVDAVRLVAVLDRELNVRLSLDDVFADARPRRLAQRWLGSPTKRPLPEAPAATGAPVAPAATGAPELPVASAPSATTTASQGTDIMPTETVTPDETLPVLDDHAEDLALIMADLARADQLPWCGDPEPVPPRRVLLTGVTGFLGGHMLLDLLRHSDAHVVCLVRGDTVQDAERRLAEGLAGFSLPWSAEIRRRVTVLPGDLRRPRLGLTDEQWELLANELDSVVSVAAAVDFLRGYPSLRRTNVLGVLTLAELAMTGRPKPLHHISSIAVFNEIGIASMGEDDPVAHVDRLTAGYDKSKWAAEAALRRARDRGLKATFLRPGGIVGHTRTGAYNPHDINTGLFSAISRYRVAPKINYSNSAPVDWVSRVATAVICEPSGWGQNYHLTGRPDTLTEMVRDQELGGLNVRVMAWDVWLKDFLARCESDPVPELEFMARVLRNPAGQKIVEASVTAPMATGERTEAFVARHKLPPPTRYDAQARLKSYERMARDGLVILPHRDDPPHLWFRETMRGKVGPADGKPDTHCSFALTLSIASMYQLVQHRTIDVRGTVSCSLLHPDPLTVDDGEIWVRPHEGVPHRHGLDHPLLRYRLALRDSDGNGWWLEGWKTARARFDYMKQARTLTIRAGREGEPASLAGTMRVPKKSYKREQIDGIRVNPNLSMREQRIAKLAWLTWFSAQLGQGLLEPTLRAGAELLDLRPDAIDLDKDRYQAKLKQWEKDRKHLR
ncbi:thioester reductase domain-containing protein [Streptomyces coeruleorubidus]|uniref:NAD-dependent epimerase/dehydratase family protein n=1 Tax=Streptomyces coeruleorubidus TaxID=116188 RepID=A0A5J6IA84_STRC4|nr:thioester reductase domain-containing protein [Streptomyces coeruleorubidus]QEV29406.1 NAD-dependent epimerase/dehydratase family protein [Streptomyces coeruleorubidus]